MANEASTVDKILIELGIGRFQVLSYVLLCMSIVFIRCSSMSFVFTARDISYRCLVPECESALGAPFVQPWLNHTTPFEDGLPKKCERFLLHNGNRSCDMERTEEGATVPCESWVYGEGESIVKTFNMPCEDGKRSSVGTINNIGQMASLLFSGYVADKYGRKNVMGIMTVAIAILGVIQSFSKTFTMFLILEFLNMATGAGAYSTTYIVAVELLSSKHRGYGSVILEGFNVVGLLVLPMMAWLTWSWQSLLIAVNVPSLISVVNFFVIPESVLWLYAKDRKKECANILNNINAPKLSPESIIELEEMSSYKTIQNESNHRIESEFSLSDLKKCPRLIIRIIICSYSWFTTILIYYGLSLFAVDISKSENDGILNFTVSTSVEILGIVLYFVTLKYCSRKYSMFSIFLGCGIACIIYAAIPNTSGVIALLLYLFSKILITTCFMLVYIYTTEMFPTCLRNTSINVCSVVGRIGGAISPQAALLHEIHPSLPMITFGVVGLLCAVLVLKLPETKSVKLPDTLKEAEEL